MHSFPRLVSVLILLAFFAVPVLAQGGQDQGAVSLDDRIERIAQALEAAEAARATQAEELRQLRRDLAEAQSQGASAEARLRELEAGHVAAGDAELGRRIETQIQALRADRGSPATSGLVFGGYFDLEFREDKAGSQNATFDQHRLVLEASAEIASWISFETELEIEGGGIANRLTDAEIVVEFAELRFALDEAINLKAGALLVPFNRFNLLHDSPIQELTDRPLIARRIVPTTWTEAGIGANGAVHFDAVSFDYDVVLVNGLTDSISANAGTRNARGSYRRDNNDDKTIVGRLGVTPHFDLVDGLAFGMSLAHGKYDDDNRRHYTMFGLDAMIREGPFEVVAEWVSLRLSRGDAERAAGIPGGMEGFFVEGRFRFFPESWRGLAPFFNDESTFTLVARYDDADTDTSTTGADFPARGDAYRDDRRRFTLGFNFRPIHRTVFKIEYQWFLEPSSLDEVDNNRFVASFATSF